MLMQATTGIYIITDESLSDSPTHKQWVYVGQAKDISRRWQQHKRALVTGKHHNRHLQIAYDKGANLRYTIVMECQLLNLTVNEWVIWQSYLSLGMIVYNIAEPGKPPLPSATKPIVATNIEGVSKVYVSLQAACNELKLNQGRASAHLRQVPKDKYRTKPAPTVNGYVLKYA